MTDKDIKIIELHVNDDDAKKKIDALKERVERLNAQRKAAEEVLNSTTATDERKKRAAETLKTVNAELKKTTRELERSENRIDALTNGLRNMDRNTPKQLKKVIREINAEINSGTVKKGSEQWEAYTRKLKEANEELERFNRTVRADREALADEEKGFGRRILDFGDKYFGIIQSVTGGMEIFDAVKSWMDGFIKTYADMQEHMAGVAKYTGLAKEEVEELNEAFKKMDTRTPREKLNDLAADAGRLGITAKDQILDFVDAANQINLALGEDLGENGVKNIGKLTQLFGVDRTMGLKNGMLATASVINELAQSSSAAEPYLLEFTARLAGVASSAKIAQSDIVAIASVLDQGMIGVEKSATAMQNVLTAIYRRPAKMAKAAGLDVKAFAQLVKTDANAALLQFIGALRDARSLDNIAPMLEQMKLSGAGVTQTLTTLAAGLDKIKDTQKQAALAFLEHTSATKEAEVANATVQGQIEKAQKAYKDLAVELGERLQPVARHVVSTTGMLAKGMLAATRFAADHKKAILQVALVLAAYKVGVLLATAAENGFWIAKAKNLIADKLSAAWTATVTTAKAAWSLVTLTLTGRLNAATMAQWRLNAAMAANPVGLVIALIAALISVFVDFGEKTEEVTQKKTALQEVQEEGMKKAAEEINIVKRLHDTVRNANESYEVRKQAIENLQRIVPGYHASLTREGKLTEHNTKAITNYIAMLQKKALAEAIYDKLVELQKRKVEQTLTRNRKQYNVKAVEREQERARLRREKQTKEEPKISGREGRTMQLASGMANSTYKAEELKTQQDALNEANKALDETNRDLAALNNLIKNDNEVSKAYGALIDRKSADIRTEEGTGTYSPPSADGKKPPHKTGSKENKLLQEERKRGKAFAEEVDKQQKEKNAHLKLRYAEGEIDAKAYHEQLFKNEEEALTKKRDFYKLDFDARRKWQEDLDKHREKEEKRTEDWTLADIDKEFKQKTAALEETEAKGLITAEAYEERRDALTLEHLKRRAEYMKQWARVEEAEKATADYEEEAGKQRLAREKKYQERLKSLRESYSKLSAEQMMEQESAVLEKLYGEKLVAEEEYLRLKAALRKKYVGTDGEGGMLGEERSKRTEEIMQEARTAARKKTGAPRDEQDAPTGGSTTTAFGVSELAGTALKLKIHAETFKQIQAMRDKDKKHAVDYDRALARLDKERLKNLADMAAAAYASFGSVVSAFSELQRAEGEEAVARTEREYDARIKQAEGDAERTKKLEAEKQEAVAKIKTEYNRRATNIQIAQAIASGAQATISAYASAAAIPVIGHVIAPIAAALAATAAAIQIATVRKQAQAQQTGFYEGGFTHGRNYRKEAGVVHEGEFVANHNAVNNPSLMPVLRLIDHAQRNNTVASLTANDVSRAIAEPGVPSGATRGRRREESTAETTPAPPQVQIAPVQTPELIDAVQRLSEQLEAGIRSVVSIDGQDGVAYQLERYKRLKANK